MPRSWPTTTPPSTLATPATPLYDIALSRGRSTAEAGERLAAAVSGHTASYVRSRAISQTKLASLLMATADPVQASAIGMQALAAAGPIRSRRAADDLRELARHTNRHTGLSEADELRHRIRTAVLAA